MPPQHGGREGLDARDEADEGIDAGELEAPQDAGRAAQGAAHEEAEGDDAVHSPMPIRAAVFWSWETARMAFPTFVAFTR